MYYKTVLTTLFLLALSMSMMLANAAGHYTPYGSMAPKSTPQTPMESQYGATRGYGPSSYDNESSPYAYNSYRKARPYMRVRPYMRGRPYMRARPYTRPRPYMRSRAYMRGWPYTQGWSYMQPKPYMQQMTAMQRSTSKPSTTAASESKTQQSSDADTTSIALIASVALPSQSVITIRQAPSGNILADAKGMTLYTTSQDRANESTCYGGCAINWPPTIASQGAVAEGDFSLVKRNDGAMQWAFKDKPLYTWVNDRKPGDMTGDGIGGVWRVAKP